MKTGQKKRIKGTFINVRLMQLVDLNVWKVKLPSGEIQVINESELTNTIKDVLSDFYVRLCNYFDMSEKDAEIVVKITLIASVVMFAIVLRLWLS